MNDRSRQLVAIRAERGSVTLVLDGGEIYEIAPDAVPDELPAVGGSIDSPLLVVIAQAAQRKRVARRVLRLLDRRLQPMAALRRKLREEGFDDGPVADVLAQLEERGMHSDRRYAEAYCRDTLLRRQVGRLYLRAKLRAKGIAAELAKNVVAAELPRERERELALAAAARRWRRERGPSDHTTKARVARFVVGRGFPAPLAREVAWSTAPRAQDLTADGPEGEV